MQFGQNVLRGLASAVLIGVMLLGGRTLAAPKAEMVIDARTGEVLHAKNADSRLHPASLTKMMTLYIAFEAVENGEIGLDTKVRISANAAAEPPSKLGLKAGSRIAFRYLIRAASVKSANDAATAIGETLSGSEAAFARRMTRTARVMGLTDTTFKNAHGLTAAGHLSTARDMTRLGRQLFYDYPQYYNLFSRRSTDAGLRTVHNTNRRLLRGYAGADGIKTGYTNASGFNLVASAKRGGKRIIATVFGRWSSADRAQRVAELFDLGFRRAPRYAEVVRPTRPPYEGKTRTSLLAVGITARPFPRPGVETPPATLLASMQTDINDALEETAATLGSAVPVKQADAQQPLVQQASANRASAPRPEARADAAIAALAAPRTGKEAAAAATLAAARPQSAGSEARERRVVTRMSTAGGRHWGVNIGRFGTHYAAQRALVKTALLEIGTMDEALRKIVRRPSGFDANFVGMTQAGAERACRRLSARDAECQTLAPPS